MVAAAAQAGPRHGRIRVAGFTTFESTGSLGQGAGLENAAAVIAWAIIVVALANYLATLDDDASMAV